MKKLNKEDLETQCKLLCEYCASGDKLCLCIECRQSEKYWHAAYANYCQAYDLRKLYENKDK